MLDSLSERSRGQYCVTTRTPENIVRRENVAWDAPVGARPLIRREEVGLPNPPVGGSRHKKNRFLGILVSRT